MTDYYISSSGSDGNAGTSSGAPWQTLAKVATKRLGPGDRILLKAGDTWTSETLHLFGGGTLAGSHPTYAGSSWAEVTSYGAGANPIINATKRNIGIRFDRNSAVPAWKLSHLEITGAQVGIDSQRAPTDMNYGLWLEDLYIHHIEGGPLYTNAAATTGAVNAASPLAWCSTGILLGSVSDVVMKNITLERCDLGVNHTGYTNCLVDNVTFDHIYRGGAWFRSGFQRPLYPYDFKSSNLTIQNSLFTWCGWQRGMYWGVGALQLDGGETLVVQDTEIEFTKCGGWPSAPDGIAIDIEVATKDVTILRCNIHDNHGVPFLFWDHGYSVTGIGSVSLTTAVLDSTFTNNGTFNTNYAALSRNGFSGTSNAVQVSGCTITRRDAGQKLFNGAGSGSSPTDTVPGHWNWGSPNANTIL